MTKLLSQAVTLAIAATTLLSSANADTAPQRWFQVEVLIFKNPELDVDNPEVWPEYVDLAQPDRYVLLQPATDESAQQQQTELLTAQPDADTTIANKRFRKQDLQPFVLLPAEQQQLTKEKQILQRDPNYSVLFHEVWNEPVPDRDNVIPIQIQGGKQFGRQHELQGYINLYVERYLHFASDLNLVKYKKSRDPFSLIDETDSNNSALKTLNNYGGLSLINSNSFGSNQISRDSRDFYIAVESAQLKESRKMRSKKIHYLDNPKFGILILITPIDIADL